MPQSKTASNPEVENDAPDGVLEDKQPDGVIEGASEEVAPAPKFDTCPVCKQGTVNGFCGFCGYDETRRTKKIDRHAPVVDEAVAA